jgi:3-hydroxyisobutyrate dehydrogenase-like beta-hydroxyacid dehydrogenase
MKIAFIGLGNMGTGIAQCILKSGHDLIVWNRTGRKRARWLRWVPGPQRRPAKPPRPPMLSSQV